VKSDCGWQNAIAAGFTGHQGCTGGFLFLYRFRAELT